MFFSRKVNRPGQDRGVSSRYPLYEQPCDKLCNKWDNVELAGHYCELNHFRLIHCVACVIHNNDPLALHYPLPKHKVQLCH